MAGKLHNSAHELREWNITTDTRKAKEFFVPLQSQLSKTKWRDVMEERSDWIRSTEIWLASRCEKDAPTTRPDLVESVSSLSIVRPQTEGCKSVHIAPVEI